MPLSRERIIYLLEAYTSQKATSQEEEELWDWMQHAQEDVLLKDYVHTLWNGHQPDQTFSEVDWDRIFNAIVSRNETMQPIPRGKRLFMHWYQVAAAVAIFAVLSAGLYFAFYKKGVSQQPVTAFQDIKAPQTNRATLTLSNGQKVYLDSMVQGALVAQDGVNVLKLTDGRIVYKGSASEELYNTLTNPRGSKVIDMLLADGTHIWLNSGSSIRYPAAFVGNERKVSITGEAYFEVAHDAKRPFKVILPSFKGVQGGEITVLGTHFNVNAYDDEKMIKTTLLEGSVLLNLPSSAPVKRAARLKPGQQARITEDLVVAGNSNLEEVMAWKNDRFDFGEKTDIETLMRQLARWYDIDVHYAGKINAHFGGSISRQVNVSEVLKLLEATGGVKFRIEGKTVTIIP
ncbi:FecR domain-containing protein [Niabella sp.]|uniref:FecR family protein n=1 Tax=Niabella sp. TaxID=1962976 RepID=UPI002633D839|nr:FecR domain-containing protein [Niabella sp.]